MELQTHNPQHVYIPNWESNPPTQNNWSEGSLAKLYDQDIYAWANTNAQLLREKRFDQLDMTNLIEEIEDMAKSEQRSLYSHLLNLLMHLLKWEFQPQFQGNSWRASIRNARYEMTRLMKESPSLKTTPERKLAEAYEQARQLAADETGLNLQSFPSDCPYTIAQVLDENWLPA
jgi:Domain of unknown function DUF29